jgi:hypothetical protein
MYQMRRQNKWKSSWVDGTVREWIDEGQPSPPPQTVKVLMLANALSVSGSSHFIETGTLKGLTSGLMAWMPGVTVDTVEISPKYFELSKDKLADFQNVNSHLGDSGVVLPKIMDGLDQPAVFWIDAHFSGGDTGKGDLMAPVKAELDSLLNHRVKSHIILIDDMRDFRGKDGYPKAEEVVDWIAKQLPQFKCEIMYNILVCMPESLYEEWLARHLNSEGLACID